ncbi:YwmB family TATA-box binding protein [Paenibacillus sp. CN-4]|uniref:YwmB family TATA-box binding protein n=1 Tax=Paenibacillus nanchangensis TaxID=3348343 RepID=UPI00397D01BE
MTRTRGSQKRHLLNHLLILLAVCCMTGLLAGFRFGQEQPASEGESAREELERLPQLIAMAREASAPASPLRVVLKWQGEVAAGDMTAEEAAVAAGKLARQLGLSEPVRTEEQGNVVYRAASVSSSAQKAPLDIATPEPSLSHSLFWVEYGKGGSYVVVTLETADARDAEVLRAQAQTAGDALAAHGVAAKWNVSLQSKAGQQGTPGASLKAAENILSGSLNGLHAEESYTDDATACRSYSVPGIRNVLRSGSRDLAVQAAVHYDGFRGENRVTLGFPMITVEY